jgi:hypothetical protein
MIEDNTAADSLYEEMNRREDRDRDFERRRRRCENLEELEALNAEKQEESRKRQEWEQKWQKQHQPHQGFVSSDGHKHINKTEAQDSGKIPNKWRYSLRNLLNRGSQTKRSR